MPQFNIGDNVTYNNTNTNAVFTGVIIKNNSLGSENYIIRNVTTNARFCVFGDNVKFITKNE
tara:strand:+ start:680 stop:865 length:186 start_codon:yes stop_codon:yes gene_type:complete